MSSFRWVDFGTRYFFAGGPNRQIFVDSLDEMCQSLLSQSTYEQAILQLWQQTTPLKQLDQQYHRQKSKKMRLAPGQQSSDDSSTLAYQDHMKFTTPAEADFRSTDYSWLDQLGDIDEQVGSTSDFML